MAALLKNQVLKHLSKFTKNLSADKLNLSAIKGSCDVHNIELDEEVLMDLLELPVWMTLKRAVCNHVSLKVQWMKLKTVPIYIALDEVVVEMETCEDFRQDSKAKTNSASNADSGKYGFGDRVVDGLTLTINSVIITFKSKVFSASLQLSRLLVESRAPNWKRTGDLRLTRIKDPHRPGGQLLLFKHLEWQTLRFEAKAESNIVQTPLRLIANQATCRITLKKKLNDCSVLGARIMFIFDDLLWVLTDAQLLSAMHFADYLGQLIKRAPRRKNFAEDLIVGTHSPTITTLKNMSANSAQTAQSAVSRLFSQYDIIETSHHIFVSRIEVHLCDDLDPNNGRSLHPSLKDGGALQITLSKLVIDVYPYQKVMGNRNHWLRYSDPSSSRSHWINQHLQTYFDKKSKSMPPQTTTNRQSSRMSGRSPINQLMSRVVLIRLSDYSISCVTTNMTSKLKLNEKLIATDKSAPLPEDMMAFYMELNSYYYFDSNQTVPDSCAFIHLAPLKVTFDSLTLLWINAFQANLHNAMVKLQEMIPQQEKQRLNTRIECLMPLIVIKCPEGFEYSSFEVKSARIIVLNCENENSVFDELNVLMEDLGSHPFMYDKQSFPWLESDPKPISDQFLSNLAKLKSCENSAEIWTIRMEPLWAEFRTGKSSKFHPLLEPLPITLWAFESQPNSVSNSDNREPDLSLVLCISSTVKVQLNHNQYLFLMRFLEQLSEFGVQMNNDTLTIQSHNNGNQNSLFKTVSLITSIPYIELVLKLTEEMQSFRSIGISPQPSILNLSSPSINEKLSETIDSEMHTLKATEMSLDTLEVGVIPKSNSDSLLTGSISSLEANKFNQNNEIKGHINSSNGIHSSSSLATSLASIPSIQTHKKLQISPNVITFKKSPNSDGLSLNSNSTFNESLLTDSSPIDDDNRSIRSDLSGESDQFVVVGFETMAQEDEDLFGNARVEAADEVKEDSIIDSPSEELETNSVSNSQLDTPISVSLVQIKLTNLNLVQQSKGFHSNLLLNCSNISLSEFIKMPFNEYQTFINQRTAKTGDDSNSSDILSSAEITLRLESYAKPDLKDELISIFVNRLESTLHMDSVMLLADFVTDPDMTYVPPTHILLSDLCFTLIDDKVSAPPLCLNVPHMFLRRDKSNQMTVSPLPKNQISVSQTEHLLSHHMRLRQRNDGTIGSSVDIEPNKLKQTDSQTEILEQILKRNETLLQEIERIKKENKDLKIKLKSYQN